MNDDQAWSQEHLIDEIKKLEQQRDLLSITPSPPKIAITKLRHSATMLIGRSGELRRLNSAWKAKNTHIFTLVAWGGVGKTSLAHEWMNRFAK